MTHSSSIELSQQIILIKLISTSFEATNDGQLSSDLSPHLDSLNLVAQVPAFVQTLFNHLLKTCSLMHREVILLDLQNYDEEFLLLT